MTVLYYGRKVARPKPPRPGTEAEEEEQRPKELAAVPNLVLGKTLMKGHSPVTSLCFDKPPPPQLTYRLLVQNLGSADYDGPVELLDELPTSVHYRGIAGVYCRHVTFAPFVGAIERKTRLEGWHVEGPPVGDSGRIRWWSDHLTLKMGHVLTVDIDFEPPPFNVSASEAESPAATAPPAARGGYLGIRTVRLTTELAVGMEYQGYGALVGHVEAGSPAEQAGLRSGDIVSRCGRAFIQSPEQLYQAIRSQAPGSQVSLQVSRNGSEQTLTVTVAASPAPVTTGGPVRK